MSVNGTSTQLGGVEGGAGGGESDRCGPFIGPIEGGVGREGCETAAYQRTTPPRATATMAVHMIQPLYQRPMTRCKVRLSFAMSPAKSGSGRTGRPLM